MEVYNRCCEGYAAGWVGLHAKATEEAMVRVMVKCRVPVRVMVTRRVTVRVKVMVVIMVMVKNRARDSCYSYNEG